MDTEKLKQKILDLAIRGKLVPQDSNDESAEELIKKIQEEKAKLVKEGKIKASKEESIIFKGSDNCYYEKIGNEIRNIDDKIPFQVPDNWTWVRLKNISKDISYGLNYSACDNGTNKFLRITDIQNGKVDWNLVPYVSIKKGEENYHLQDNDIVFARTGATVGKSFLIKEALLNSVFASYLIRIRLMDTRYAEYVNTFFNCSYYWNQIIDNSSGTGQPNCNGTKLANLLIPLCPLNEATRISSILSKPLTLLNEINSEYRSIIKLIDAVKSKILDSVFSEDSSYKSYYENEYLLDDLLPYEQPGPYIVKSTNYDDKYDIPVLTPGKSFILGYINEKEGIYRVNNSKAIIFDDFTTASRLIDFNFKVKSSAMKILKSSDESKFNIDYLYFLLQTLYVNNDTHKRYWISEFAIKKVKVHTFDDQIKIVKTINDITNQLDYIIDSKI